MQLIRLKYATHVVIQQLFNKIIYAYKFLFVIVLKDIRNFRCGFVISLALITFLTNPAIAMPHKAHSQSFPSIPKIGSINTTSNNKVVILNFDDGYESQYTNAKPILDQYGYKATFYIICNYVGDEEEEQDNSNARMSWEDITELHKEGYDIGSHSMDHKDLSQMSEKMVDFEVGDSKQCLVDHGINPISFAYPFNTAAEDATVIDIVAKYYDIARRGDNPLMFLHCDGFKEKSSQSDCKTYSDNGELNFVNRYSIIGWSHDGDRKTNSYDDSEMLNRFIEVVNSQAIYNTDGTINAIPIVTWHRIDNSGEGDPGSYATTIDLFEKEIKYLHDNGFKVLTMADLGYDTNSNYLYLKR
jgi:peptidoglycan/xylan/chitin deacetylase (PgdA/CDA1 family)